MFSTSCRYIFTSKSYDVTTRLFALPRSLFNIYITLGIYPSNFDVRFTAQKNSILQLSFETQSSYICFGWLFVCLFVLVFT